jgi:anti-sigma B factor antagonist
MRFDVKENGSSTLFLLHEKKLDSSISAELKGEFLLLCKPKTTELIVDLSEVDFCDSGGLSALLIAERKMREHGGTVKLAGLRKKVLSLIKISQLDRVFQIVNEVQKISKH